MTDYELSDYEPEIRCSSCGSWYTMSDDEVRTFEPPKDAITKVTVRLCHDCLFRGFDVRKLITFCFEAKTDNHGCFTGDCAHTNQAQCTETILQQFMAD